MWIYIWAVHESLSKYGTFTYFPGCHTELGNNLLLADAFLKYCNMVLENIPHRLDSKKFRKVNSAATWVCFIKFKQLAVMWYFIIHCEPESCLPTKARGSARWWTDLAAQHLQSDLSHLLLARTLAAESCPLAIPTLASIRSFGELIQQKISPFF